MTTSALCSNGEGKDRERFSVFKFQGLEEAKKERFVKKIFAKGVSVKQLSRLTGTSKGMIEKYLKS